MEVISSSKFRISTQLLRYWPCIGITIRTDPVFKDGHEPTMQKGKEDIPGVHLMVG
jgi:hypothetical protein